MSKMKKLLLLGKYERPLIINKEKLKKEEMCKWSVWGKWSIWGRDNQF